jgi:uncharacterized membrane protein
METTSFFTSGVFYITLTAILLGVHNYLIPGTIAKGLSVRSLVFYRELFSSVILLGAFIVSWKAFGVAWKADPKGILFTVLSGLCGYLMLEAYYKAMTLGKKGPVSTIVYSYIAPVALIGALFAAAGFTFFGSFHLLSGKSYLSIAAIVIGIGLLSSAKKDSGVKGNDQKRSIRLAFTGMLFYVGMMIFFGSVPKLLGVFFGAFCARFFVFLPGLALRIARPQQYQPLPKRLFWHVLALSALLAAVMTLLSKAFQVGDKGVVAAIYGANPLVTWLLALAFDKEERRVRPAEAIGLLTAITGAVLLSLWNS